MQEERSQNLSNLPKRKQSRLLNSIGKKTLIASNYYPITIKSFRAIYIFKIVFTPYIENNNRLQRETLLKQALPSIKKQIDNPIFGGMNLFSRSAPKQDQFVHEVENYKILIKKVKCVDVQNKDNNKALLQFLNNGIRNIMKNLKYIQIGQTRKYFDQTSLKQLCHRDNKKLNIYAGFKTSILAAEGGLFLRIDPTNKIVQNQNVLDFFASLRYKYQTKERDERRNIMKEAIINKIVMTNYGKTRYLKVQDVEFRVLKQVMVPIPGRQINILQYYKEKYQLSTNDEDSNLSRPLLRVQNKNKKDPNPIYILPQYCLLTGLPQDMDENTRRKLSDQTLLDPDGRYKKISSFIQNIRTKMFQQQFAGLEIQIQRRPQQIQGFNLQSPTVYLGKQNTIQKGKQSFFSLFDKPLFDTSYKLKLGIICSKSQDYSSLKQSLKTTSKNLKIQVQFDFAQLTKTNSDISFQDSVISAVKQLKLNFQKNCCLIVIPAHMKKIYPQIKKRCLQQARMVTQVVLESTLRNRNARTIQTKILLQMAAKVGNILWITKNPKQLVGNTMLLGFDTSRSGKANKISGVATIDKDMAKLICQSMTLKQNHDKFHNMALILNSLVDKYIKLNKQIPKNVLVLINSCPKNQIKLYQEYFLPQLKIPAQINLTVVQVRDLSTQRFFLPTSLGKAMMNPFPGLLVRDTIVTTQNDFYLISQKNHRGCTVPIYFNIVTSKQKLEEGIIEQLMYYQCFNYANWTGSIKIPAILQYAKKFARFSSEVLGDSNIKDESLCKKPYFI